MPSTCQQLQEKYPLINTSTLRPLTPFPDEIYSSQLSGAVKNIEADPERFGVQVLAASVLADASKAAGELRRSIRARAKQDVDRAFAKEIQLRDQAQEQVARCFAEIQLGMLESFPEEMKSILSEQAWDRGHSAGHSEVLSILHGLVSDWEGFAAKAKAAGL